MRKAYVTSNPNKAATFLLTSDIPSVPTLPRNPATIKNTKIKNMDEKTEYINYFLGKPFFKSSKASLGFSLR